MKIQLIRHGMTIANENKLYCGQTDLSLSPKGIEQLAKLKSEVMFQKGDVFIASTLKRTSETLEVLYSRKPDVLISELNEFSFGDFEMKSHEQLKNEETYVSWINEIENFKCPNGESKEIFEQRVRVGFEKIKALNKKSVVVVCHGGVISVIMSMLFPNQYNFYEWQPAYGRGYVITEENEWIEQFKL